MLTAYDISENNENKIAQYDNSFELSDEQKQAVDAAIDFVTHGSKSYFVIGGYAGTGKSSIIPKLRKLIEDEIYARVYAVQLCLPVLAYTGKAVTVLMRKGIKDAQTIHSFLYFNKKKRNKNGTIKTEFVFKDKSHFNGINVVIVDEASMVDKLFFDRFVTLGLKVIYIGDHFQLPPVGDKFNIMENPDFTLTKVLRQNENNPIVKMATIVRNGEFLPVGRYGNSFHLPIDKLKDEYLPKFDQIITWTNKSRKLVNEKVRNMLGFHDTMPQVHDKMIVKENNREQMVFNGQIIYAGAKITRIEDKKFGTIYKMNYIDELEKADIYCESKGFSYTRESFCTIGWSREQIDKMREIVSMKNFDNKYHNILHLDFGYAITCHASQGSSWKDVCVLDEKRHRYMDEWYRWMYTAITRAEERVVVYSEL